MLARTDAAEHEAAHVVVGAALGLRLRKASVGYQPSADYWVHGFTWFHGYKTHSLALGIMYCAGVAWEARRGGSRIYTAGDRAEARRWLARSRHDLRTAVKIADEIISSRARTLARVARELCDRDLGPAELAELVLGD